MMNIKLVTASLLLGTLLAPMTGFTEDSDKDRSSPKTYVKDSAITTKIKAKLATESLASTMQISVDTDSNGVVVLSGTAKTKAEVEQAVSIARNTEGVKSVTNDIRITATP